MNKCPKCSTEFSEATAGGLCPACLLNQGFDSQIGAANPQDAVTTAEPAPQAAVDPPLSAERLAALLPQFDQFELIGRGGMGVVYKARQKNLDRPVALKVLSPAVADSPGFAERFAREARAMARLNHPNVVAVYDFGIVDNAGAELCYFTMEFVDGSNLRGLLKQLSSAQALAIIPQICDALQYAHDSGIIHRDIKPENILIDKMGRAKIADFGLAKLLRQAKAPMDYTLTRGEVVMGTPSYMAPEQLEHPTEVDHRADLYSLGVVFYEMLTGQLPKGRFALPSQKVLIDVRFDEIVLKALEHDRELRYQHASEVRTSVESVRNTPPEQFVEATPISPPASVPSIPDQASDRGKPIAGAVEHAPPHHSRMAVSAAVFSGIALAVGFALLIFAAGYRRTPTNPTFFASAIGIVGLTLGISSGSAGLLMGWLATIKILQSEGRLRGLQPALFAGMLLPAIALAIIVGTVAFEGTVVAVATTLPGTRVNPMFPAMVAGWVTLASTAFLVWRFARKHPRNDLPPVSATAGPVSPVRSPHAPGPAEAKANAEQFRSPAQPQQVQRTTATNALFRPSDLLLAALYLIAVLVNCLLVQGAPLLGAMLLLAILSSAALQLSSRWRQLAARERGLSPAPSSTAPIPQAQEHDPELRYQHASEVRTSVEAVRNTPPPSGSAEPHGPDAPPSLSAGSVAPIPVIEYAVPASPSARLSRIAVVAPICGSVTLFGVAQTLYAVRFMNGHRTEHWVIEDLSAGLIVTGFFGLAMTFLGIIAVAQIRRSPEKLYGLRLALFDALFFPLLLLNAAVLGALAVSFVSTSYEPVTGAAPTPDVGAGGPEIWILMVGVLVFMLALDGLVYWLLWRKLRISKHARNPTPEVKPSEEEVARRQNRQLIAAMIACCTLGILGSLWPISVVDQGFFGQSNRSQIVGGDDGIHISTLIGDSPAAKAGVLAGDEIKSLRGQRVHLNNWIDDPDRIWQETPLGTNVEIKLLRTPFDMKMPDGEHEQVLLHTIRTRDPVIGRFYSAWQFIATASFIGLFVLFMIGPTLRRFTRWRGMATVALGLSLLVLVLAWEPLLPMKLLWKLNYSAQYSENVDLGQKITVCIAAGLLMLLGTLDIRRVRRQSPVVQDGKD